MAATVSTPVKRSWAQIVHGDSTPIETTQKAIKPAARGTLLRLCRGKVLTMLSHYGWLMLYGEVDHPSAEEHGGDVYFHKADVVDGESICPGDIVTFYLYVDDKGLGAEFCQVEEKASSHFNTDAAEFVPASAKPKSQLAGFSMRASADELVPGNAFSQRTMSDPSLDDEGQFDVGAVSNVCWRLSTVFASDDEDDEGNDFIVPLKVRRAPSSDGSTSGGATSDSEDEDTSVGTSSDSEDEAPSELEMLAAITKMLPPGMPLPANFRPPPGLGLPLGLLPPGLTLPPGLLEETWAF